MADSIQFVLFLHAFISGAFAGHVCPDVTSFDDSFGALTHRFL
jgi:hypothetical protein